MMDLPETRYYGSKRKLVGKIYQALLDNDVRFDSFLDLFGGTGIVSYYMLSKGKEVIYNDIFSFNCQIAKALLQRPTTMITPDMVLSLLKAKQDKIYKSFIHDNFSGIYYTDEENALIDIAVQNIHDLPSEYVPSAYYILFQSCICKRPFNLFHRSNLNLRLNHCESSFGNFVTWSRSFEELFLRFYNELNKYSLSSDSRVKVSNCSALSCDENAELVYIDTPYFSEHGSNISYHSRYHFLEGLMHYADVPKNINREKKNLEITINKNRQFESRAAFLQELDMLIDKYKQCKIAISYTSSGFPSVMEIETLLRKYKTDVRVISLGKYKFALNKNNSNREEVLIIGK